MSRIIELASRVQGASILTATSYDPMNPPEAIIDGEDDTFWCMTGSFPQEIIVNMGGELCDIQSIQLWMRDVKTIRVDKCEGPNPLTWESIVELDVTDQNGQIQFEECDMKERTTATFLKIVISSAWSDFPSIHRVSVLGHLVNN